MPTGISRYISPGMLTLFYHSRPWWRRVLSKLPTESLKFQLEEYDEWAASWALFGI